jgi:hypothetical protein
MVGSPLQGIWIAAIGHPILEQMPDMNVPDGLAR